MCDYELGFAIMELIGEWNDAIENDIQTLKRNVIDQLQHEGIFKFILIAENVLNFHSGDREYYEEWYNECAERGGWLVCLNTPEQTLCEFRQARLSSYIHFMINPNWRSLNPMLLFEKTDNDILRLLPG